MSDYTSIASGALHAALHFERDGVCVRLALPNGTCVADGRMELAVRFPDRVSHKVFLRMLTSVEDLSDGYELTFGDEDELATAQLRVAATTNGLSFGLEVETVQPLWMVEWRLEGFRIEDVIVPALGGQQLTADMPAGESVAYKYPFWWNAQFAIGTLADGGLLLSTREVHPQLKVLRVQRAEQPGGGFNMGLAFEADAPLDKNRLSASWSVEHFTGEWHVGLERHREWMESAFGLVPQRDHPRRPAWVDEIDFVLEMWGMRGDRGRPGHTFDEMIERIERFSELHSPESTLVYLPGFAEEGIDTNAPSYEPAPKCGGREGFARLVGRAHELGYRVMIHTNVLAMTYSHPRFAEFANKQVCDPFGRLQGWGMDIDGDWLAEPFFAYINPGYNGWGELMSVILGELIDSFSLDSVFIDQTLLAFNDSRGPNFMIGMREHIQRLQHDHPDVLFAGEGLHEQVLGALPVAQIHGVDSIADVHGMEGTASWRKVHPVSVELFGRYTRFLPHLLTRHPSHPAFERQEAAYRQLKIMPTLVLYDRVQAIDHPALVAMLDRARSRKEAIHQTTQLSS
jgi:hypothetical protein